MQSGSSRPRDADATRAGILDAARQEFTARGFRSVTVRAIADHAGVSPNLITRYFGGKDGLFEAAFRVELGVDAMFDGPRASLGRRMADAIVGRWTSVAGRDPMLALMRAAGDQTSAAEFLADLLDRESLAPLRAQLVRYGLSEKDAAERARAVDVLLVGVTARLRLLRDELGDPAEVVAWLAPAIQRLVDGR